MRNSFSNFEYKNHLPNLNKSWAPFQQGITLTNKKAENFDGTKTRVRFNIAPDQTLPRRLSPPLNATMRGNLRNSRILTQPFIPEGYPIHITSPHRISPRNQCVRFSPPKIQGHLIDPHQSAENFKNLYLQTLNEVNVWKSRFESLQNQIPNKENAKDIVSLENELTTMREVIDLRNREIKEWKRKFEESNFGINQQEIQKYQEALLLLASENERLHLLSSKYIEELNTLSSSCEELEFMRQKLEQTQREKGRFEAMHKESSEKYRDKELENQELRMKLSQQSQYYNECQQLHQEITQLRGQLYERDLQLGKFQILETEIRNQKSLLERSKNENIRLNSNLAQLTSAQEAVNHELRLRTEELERMRVKANQIDFNEREALALRAENENFHSKELSHKQNVAALQTEIKRLGQTIASLRNENQSFQEISVRINSLAEERDSLFRDTQAKSDEIERLKAKIRVLEPKVNEANSLSLEINKLMDVISSKDNELNRISSQLNETLTKVSSYSSNEQKILEQSRRAELLVQEIERLRESHNMKNDQLTVLNQKIIVLESELLRSKEFASGLEQLRRQEDLLFGENEELKRKIYSLSDAINIKDINIENLNNQISRLLQEKSSYQNLEEERIAMKERIIRFLMILMVQTVEIESLRNQLDSRDGKMLFKTVTFSPSTNKY